MAAVNNAILSATSSGNVNVGSGGGSSFFSNFSSIFLGRKSDDGVYPKENDAFAGATASSMSSAISSLQHHGTDTAKNNRRDSSHHRNKGSHRSSAASSITSSWSWRRRFSGRTSIGGAASAVAEKFTSTSSVSHSSATPQASSGAGVGALQHAHTHQHAPGSVGVCSTCEQFKLSTSLRERVIQPKKVPDFLIPTMTPSDRQRLIGGSYNNLRSGSNSNHTGSNNTNATSNLKAKGGMLAAAEGTVTSSSSFYGALPSSGTSNELASDRQNRMGDRWRRGSIPSSLDNLIYGTLQTNELIKRSSTELINDLVQIIAPESSRKQTVSGSDMFGLPSPKNVRPVGGSLSEMNTSSNGELLKVSEGRSASAYSSSSVAGRTSCQWECYQRCIASVRFQLIEHQKYCVLSVFVRRLHNSAATANFYSSLKSSVMQWKIRLIVATKACNVLVKKKYTINGPMPLEENQPFTGVRLPRLSRLLNQTCSVWLRLQLCHRPIDDYDDDDQDDNGLWQQTRNRRSNQNSASRRATARTQRFPPFHVFIGSLLPVTPEWCLDIECPSVKLARREKQQEQPPQPPSQHPVYCRSFAAFPCSSNPAAAFDKTLLSSGSDKRNMVIALLSLTCYVFASSSSDVNEPLNVVIDVREVHWKKPGVILTKFLDFWLFAKITHCDGREEKSKTGMKTSRLWRKSEVNWRIRTCAKRGSVKSVVIRLSGRTINTNVLVANVELSESSEDYVAAQLFHTIFRHIYQDDNYNRPAETLSKSLLLIAGDGDENSASIRRCFAIETVLPLVAA